MVLQTRKLHFERAKTANLLAIFNKYASVNQNGEKFMTPQDFMTKFLGLFPNTNYNADSMKLFAGVVNAKKDGLISFAEFQTFEGLLCFPDALYKTAFRLFDTNGNGEVSFDEFKKLMTKTELHKHIQFNMNSGFVDLYFGKNRKRKIDYSEFSQFLHDFHEEYAIEAFRRFDKDGTGFISLNDFQDIMISTKKHLLTPTLESHLIETASSGKHPSRWVSFPYFIAFNSLLNNMEVVKRIYLNVTHGHKNKGVTKEDFMHSAQTMSQITPLEVDILFQLSNALHHTGRIVYSDLSAIAPEPYYRAVLPKHIAGLHTVSSSDNRDPMVHLLETIYRFTLGGVAGGFAAAVVYPIDLVKTRIQHQRTGSYVGEGMYKNSWDCFKKVLSHEGYAGLYKGLLPQTIGVAPEKAIKLTANDFIRDRFTDTSGYIPLWAEVFAGAAGGTSQVIFTNPMEIVKIRLQLAGEVGKKILAHNIVKELGLFGMFKGTSACLLRDVPFTAIYFPTYMNLKARIADETGYNSPLTLFLAGITAGVPAAALVTPADVIKTRLQSEYREGETTYNGIWDAATKINREEGHRALWKGTFARVCRVSPQFGITLLTYEVLQRVFVFDFGGNSPQTGTEGKVKKVGHTITSTNPDHIGGYQVARPIFSGIETKFGLCLPKFSVVKT